MKLILNNEFLLLLDVITTYLATKYQIQSMPQIRIEVTDSVQIDDIDELMLSINQIVSDLAKTAIENCKSRFIWLNKYKIGDGTSNQNFIHIEITLYEGRSDEAKSEIAEAIHHLLISEYDFEFVLSVYFNDMKRSSYYKY
ncbi:MAG: DUF1904 family protein [Candidatus Heimdallarchaeota archaeon]|nr:DUF1904 family protein [Candidatus Heimdallarchaeota archaeon]